MCITPESSQSQSRVSSLHPTQHKRRRDRDVCDVTMRPASTNLRFQLFSHRTSNVRKNDDVRRRGGFCEISLAPRSGSGSGECVAERGMNVAFSHHQLSPSTDPRPDQRALFAFLPVSSHCLPKRDFQHIWWAYESSRVCLYYYCSRLPGLRMTMMEMFMCQCHAPVCVLLKGSAKHVNNYCVGCYCSQSYTHNATYTALFKRNLLEACLPFRYGSWLLCIPIEITISYGWKWILVSGLSQTNRRGWAIY